MSSKGRGCGYLCLHAHRLIGLAAQALLALNRQAPPSLKLRRTAVRSCQNPPYRATPTADLGGRRVNIQNFRRLCIRYEKALDRFRGMLQLATALLLLRTVYG